MLKSLENNGNFCGGSAEVCVPLKGEVSASAPNHPQPGLGQIDERAWSDPQAYYDGPAYDCAPGPLTTFWQAALTNDVTTLRTQWPRFKGKVPDGLAADLVADIHGRGK